jgi:Siphovirus Gp157
MSLPVLYELTQDFRDWMDIEDPTEEDSALLAIVAGQIEKKAENICKLVKWLESTAEVFKGEEKRIADRRKSMENKAARVREFLKASLLNADITKVSAGTFKISVSLSPGTVVIDDIDAIPGQYITIIPAQKKADLNAIKAAIKADPRSMTGAHVEAGFTLRIL